MVAAESTEDAPDPPSVNLFDNTELGLERAISGAALRQSLLANNIANANTPGYQPEDVDFHGVLAQAMQTGDPSTIASVQFTPVTEDETMGADGNGVDIDVESADLAENGLEYEALVGVAKTRLDILQYAMGAK